MKTFASLAILCLAPCQALAAAPAASLIDNRGTLERPDDRGREPLGGVVMNGVAYYSATDDLHGRELWRSDGTAAGTRRVLDIRAGAQDSDPESLLVVGDELLFSAEDAFGGRELWRSDGTAAGTTRVRDVAAGTRNGLAALSSINEGPAAVFGGKLYFVADDGDSGAELWVSDGTADGTVIVKDIQPGSGGSEPQHLTVAGGKLFFSANGGGSDGRELWVSDGTGSGTVLVENIFPTSGQGSAPDQLTAAGERLFFVALDGSDAEADLWTSDGTAEGTQRVRNLGATSVTVPDRLHYVPGLARVFFTAAESGGRELWVSDGTDAGTVQVLDIRAGTGSSSPQDFHAFGNRLLFRADDGTHGSEPWVSDGTAEATGLVLDISPGSGGSTPGVAPAMVTLGEQAYFNLASTTDGSTLWRTDGTAGGTDPVGELDGTARQLLVLGEQLLLASDARTSEGEAYSGEVLWTSDGETNARVRPGLLDSGFGSGSIAFLGRLFFGESHDSTEGAVRALSASNGTAAGTDVVKDLLIDIMGSPAGGPTEMLASDTTLYFLSASGNESANPGDRDLWISDGTGTGTLPVAGSLGAAGPLQRIGSTVYFTKAGASELWKSAGGGAAELVSNASLAPIEDLSVAGTTLYFHAASDSEGRELHVSDGTGGGTGRITNVNPEGDTEFVAVTVADEQLYFIADDGEQERLYRIGTVSESLVEIANVSTPSDPRLVATGEAVYFPNGDEAGGVELWRTDGTAEGTSRVADLAPGAPGSEPSLLTAFGDHLVFVARDAGAERITLYRTDGDGAPRALGQFRHVESIHPAPGAEAFVIAADGGDGAGVELWASDGEVAAQRVQDIAPGADGSFPADFSVVGERLYFSADAGATGRELWVVDTSDLVREAGGSSGGRKSGGGGIGEGLLLALLGAALIRRRRRRR